MKHQAPQISWIPTCIYLLLGLMLGNFCAPSVDACTVPVFRYALEKWEADPYLVMIFHRGELDDSVQSLVEKIEKASQTEPVYTNVIVEVVNVEETLDKFQKNIWEQHKNQDEQPWMVVLFPVSSRINDIIWSGKPSLEALNQIFDSPVRQEISKQILAGQSAVWLFLESGDKQKDAKALKTLQAELKRMEKVLQLPEIADEDKVHLSDDGPKLQVAFSILKFSANDPKEKFFIQSLMKTEEGLDEFKGQPMVIPVFGQGRALYTIIGDGINPQVIEDAASFLVGACSCQVKNQNPGVDLLMTAGWRNQLKGEFVKEEEIPPLIGLPEIASNQPETSQNIENSNGDQLAQTDSSNPSNADPLKSPNTGSEATQTSAEGSKPTTEKNPTDSQESDKLVAMNHVPESNSLVDNPTSSESSASADHANEDHSLTKPEIPSALFYSISSVLIGGLLFIGLGTFWIMSKGKK